MSALASTAATASDVALVPEVRAEMIRAEHKAAQAHQEQSIQHAIRCGELLIGAKRGIPHGEWSQWLAANVKFSDTAARGYMRLAGIDEPKRQRVADMTLRQALKAIAKNDQRQRARERQIERDLIPVTVVVPKIERPAPEPVRVVVPIIEPPKEVALVGELMARPGRENIAATKAVLKLADEALDAIAGKVREPAALSAPPTPAATPSTSTPTPTAPEPRAHVADAEEVQAIVDQIKTNLADADLLLVAVVALKQISKRGIQGGNVSYVAFESVLSALVLRERGARTKAEKAARKAAEVSA